MSRWATLVAVVIMVAGMAGAQVPAAERTALLDLYDSTNGPSWVTASGWGGAAGSECSWHGVACLGGRVTRLALPANGLIGELPATFVDLMNLSFVDLDYNGV